MENRIIGLEKLLTQDSEQAKLCQAVLGIFDGQSVSTLKEVLNWVINTVDDNSVVKIGNIHTDDLQKAM